MIRSLVTSEQKNTYWNARSSHLTQIYVPKDITHYYFFQLWVTTIRVEYHRHNLSNLDLSTQNIKERSSTRIECLTCGYRSRSRWRCPSDGRPLSSAPVHISYKRFPKQIMSIFSSSVAQLDDHRIALTRDDSPRRLFSIPVSLREEEACSWLIPC